jgi:hypothetical protein
LLFLVSGQPGREPPLRYRLPLTAMQPSDDASALHNLDVMSVDRRLNRPNNIRVVFAD